MFGSLSPLFAEIHTCCFLEFSSINALHHPFSSTLTFHICFHVPQMVFFVIVFSKHVGRSFLLFEAVASSGDACRKTLIWRFQDGKRGRLLFVCSFLFLKHGCQRGICISLKGIKRQTSKVIKCLRHTEFSKCQANLVVEHFAFKLPV